MSKFIIVLTLITIISGCSDTITRTELEKATEYCQDKGGIDKIQTILGVSIHCKYGESKFTYNMKEKTNASL